jgi:hypothetical protein
MIRRCCWGFLADLRLAGRGGERQNPDLHRSRAGAYAFRLLGNYSSDAEFLQLIGATHINGLGATYSFDGIYTRVAAVPEPATYAMMFAGLALVGVSPSPHQGLAHIKAGVSRLLPSQR